MPSKKTHKEYIDEVALINPNIEVLETYIGSNKKILHRCKIDGYEWHVTPNSVLSGHGCPKCGGSMKKTHEKYVEQVAAVNPNIEVVGEYINSKLPIMHRCNIDGCEWMAEPCHILAGHGCPRCAGYLKKTHEQYVTDLARINSNIEVVGQYIDSGTKILHRCKIDGYEWLARPGSILYGYGCPKCSGNAKKTHEQYVEELNIVNSNLIVLGNYINTNTPILHKCKKHNVEWEITPSNALHGAGCHKCGNEKIGDRFRKTHEEYVAEVAAINSNIEVIGVYVDAKTNILHRCKADGYEWMAAPGNILDGHGCPKCNESRGEKLVAIWLDDNNIVYERQKKFEDCKDKQPLPFDFYLPNYNIAIEYNGKQHYEPIDYFGGQEGFEYVVKHDKIKEDYCKENNIPLIVIPYSSDICEELEKMYESIVAKEVA